MAKKYRNIKIVITDVDGVLTDGGIYTGPKGILFKKFNVKDGAGVQMLKSIGIDTVIMSSETDELNQKILESRSQKIGVKHCFSSVNDKYKFLLNFMRKNNLESKNIVYIADDINDLPAITLAGIRACPADAVHEIKKVCNMKLSKNGGKGCFRELVNKIVSNLTIK